MDTCNITIYIDLLLYYILIITITLFCLAFKRVPQILLSQSFNSYRAVGLNINVSRRPTNL